MNLLVALTANKGTVSSALGKELAGYALEKDITILHDAIDLSTYQLSDKSSKNIRAGAAKIVEIIAEKQPALVAEHLEKLIPALTVDEPQTKWMIFCAIGFCAHLNPKTARECIPYAVSAINLKQGLCLSSSAILYLGNLGAVSKQDAKKVFPIINEESKHPIKNEEDWILEAYMNIAKHLDNEKTAVEIFADKCLGSTKKATHKRVAKLKNILNS